jgi:hypothetical protein
MLKDEERERIRMGHLMEEMLKTEGWKAFATFVSERGNQVFLTLTPPLKSWDSVLEQEYQKGTLRGIELTMETPARIVAEMHQLLESDESEEVTNG